MEAASIVNFQNLPRPGDPTHIAFAAGASPVVTPSGLVTIAFYRSDDKRPDLVLASVLRG